MSKEFIFELDNALYNEETGEAVFKPKVKRELVRCGECKYDGHCVHQIYVMQKDRNTFFCADGERRGV